MQFQVEAWSDALPELRPLFTQLWDDVAMDKDRFVARCDEQKYAGMEAANLLHVATMREDGKLAGFFVSIIVPNPHYLGQGLMVFTDMYYVLKEFRRGNFGIKLFAFAESSWRARGAVKAYTSHKVHRDRSRLLKALGWKPCDIMYSKVLA